MKEKITKRIVWRVYTKIKGVWFNKEFPIKEEGKRCCGFGAKTEKEVRQLAGKTGNIYKITTIAEPIYLGTD